MDILARIQSLPTEALIGLGVLLVVQVILDVIALTDLYKRPVEQLVLPNKWIWVAIILLVSTIGAILYLVVGRKRVPVMADARPSSPVGSRATDAADLLYGQRTDADPR